MSDRNLDHLLSGTVESVLETMFFSAVLGPAAPQDSTDVRKARIAFRGNPCGIMQICLSDAGARALAAGFLGEEEESVTDVQSGQVLCELANMLCGSAVSKLENERTFELASPELVSESVGADLNQDAAVAAEQSFELENGILTVTLRLETDA